MKENTINSNRKPRILVISPFYLPGYQSGALRTLANLVERLGDEFDFRIITDDHDVNDLTPYSNIKIGDWNEVEKANVFYMSAKSRRWKDLKRIFKEVNPDIVYLNSFFFPLIIQYLTMRRRGLIEKKPTIITPKGELSAGALKVKSTKKRIFMTWAKLSGLYRDLVWQASVKEEVEEILKFQANSRIYIVNDLPTRSYALTLDLQPKTKEEGKAGFIFVSRIDPKKNLKKAIKLLSTLTGEVDLDIYGPIAFQDYWNECLYLINNLPPNINIVYKGLLKFEDVLPCIRKSHFFLLPTLGENFGHVVIESLSAGTPVIISDNTPWRNLENSCLGFDLSLEDEAKWLQVLQSCVRMNDREYQKMSEAARKFALKYFEMPEAESANRSILLNALGEFVMNK